MDNIVSFEPDRPRPQRALGVPRSGARILFFTGVRYCRDDGAASFQPGRDDRVTPSLAPSGRGFEAATH